MTWNKPFLYLCFMLIFFTACTSSKKYDYFQQGKVTTQRINDVAMTVNGAPLHLVDNGDVLEVNYYTPEEINQSIISSSDEGEKKSKINLFQVNSQGNIDFPLVGACQVKGLTIDQVKDTVSARLKLFFNITYVYVRLNSFHINVIGEVKRPGLLAINNDQATLLSALSEAGDLTDYGNKKQVVLLRKVDGKMRIYEFDLTDINIINSEGFYLKSNDTIYVKPLRIKSTSAIMPFISVGLIALNTVLVILQFTSK